MKDMGFLFLMTGNLVSLHLVGIIFFYLLRLVYTMKKL